MLYVSGQSAPVTAQVTCDGEEIKDLFPASGISAAISKAIPYYLDRGYAFHGCTDNYVSNQTGAYAYSRCFFVKER